MAIVCNDNTIPINFFTIGNLILGMILYRLNIPLKNTIFLYILFEIIQNILIRISFIGYYWRKLDRFINICFKKISLNLKWEPYYGDSLSNSIFDICAVVIGWLISSIISSSQA